MTTPAANYEVVVEPDFGQFYLRRQDADWQSDAVPADGYERLLWSSGTFVMVGTVRKYGPTPLRVQVLDSAPEMLPDDPWKHVVEDSLGPGGDLEVFSWPGDQPVMTVSVPHHAVRLRVGWAGLDEANDFEGLDEHGNSEEHLLVQVWPQEVSPANVRRWWPPLQER
jgi:hypothetical protein